MDKYVILEAGNVYELLGGGSYECLKQISDVEYLMRRSSDGWTCEVYGVRMTADGKIHWNYSLRGRFAKKCKHCGNEAIYKLALSNNAEIDVCEDCDNMYGNCEGCGCSVLDEDLFTYDGENYYCEKCYDAVPSSKKCEHCSQQAVDAVGDINNRNPTWVCEDCKSKYKYCSDCGHDFFEGEGLRSGQDGRLYCESCI